MRVVFLTLLAVGYVWGHTYHLGACPVVEPMVGFDMSKMFGVWYVIQKTSTASHCITYTFNNTEEPGTYELIQDSQHFILGLTPLKHDYKYTGVLKVKDASVPGKMTVHFPLSIAGSASFTMVATDYENYAAVFTCQKLAFAHRRSATILSRRRDLEKMYVDKLRTRLGNFGVDPFDLSIISQTDCPQHQAGVNISIDPNTFSTHNIGNAVRKAGGYVADGVELAVETGKKVYHKVTDDKEELTNNAKPNGSTRNLNDDAEWLP